MTTAKSSSSDPKKAQDSVTPIISFTKEWVEIPRPWLIRYEPDVPREYGPDEGTLPEMLLHIAQKYPDQIALIFMGAKISYRDLLHQAQHLGAVLQKSGVKKGARVAIMLPNTPQYVVSFYGALMAGAVVVNTSPLYSSEELAHQLEDSGAETLIILDSLYSRYAEIKGETGIKRVLVTGIQDALPFPLNVIYPIKAKIEKNWVEVPRSAQTRFWKDIFATKLLKPTVVDIASDDVAILQYTGGTTGLPKGAMLSHRNLIANCEQSRKWIGNVAESVEVVMAAIPFFHVYGMTVAMNMSINLAATAVLIPNPRDIPTLLKQLAQYKVTIFPGVPTLYNAIANYADAAKYDLTSIRGCISGSAPLLRQTVIDFKNVAPGSNLVEGYGLTEASPCTHVNPLFINQREGIGIPLSGVHAIVADDEGNILPPDSVGELWICGPNVMKGYWNRPEETKDVLREAYGRVWLRTGDMATMDPEGYFKIVDRKKDLILVSGWNVYPREVEEIIKEHPAILEVAVVGIPHPYKGEAPHAVVVLKENTALSEEQMITYCRSRIGPNKVPVSVEFREELPKSSVMKILRRQLSQEWKERNLPPESAEQNN